MLLDAKKQFEHCGDRTSKTYFSAIELTANTIDIFQVGSKGMTKSTMLKTMLRTTKCLRTTPFH